MPIIDLEITFGKCSFSNADNTATLPIFVDRNKIPKLQDLEAAESQVVFGDRFFCDKRLAGKLIAVPPGGEAAGQKRLPGTAEEIKGNFDAKSFVVRADELKFSAKFCRDDMKITADELLNLDGRSGRLIVDDVLSIPAKDSGDEDDECDDHPDLGPIPKQDLKARGKQLFGSDPGAGMPLTDLIFHSKPDAKLSLAMIVLVREAIGGETIGDLEAFCRKWPEGWVKKIKGMGKDKITRLTDALEAFRKANPIPDDDHVNTMAEDEAAEAKEREGQSAYKQGREAFLDGVDPSDNPFSDDSAINRTCHKDWQDGWDDEERQHKAENEDSNTILDEANA